MSLGIILLVLIVGIFVGFINTLSGGGSLLTMPMLIFLGLPTAVANGTNRFAVMVQNIVAVVNFKRQGYFDLKLNFMLGIPAVIGSIFGSFYAISLSDEIFNKILATVMFLILFLIIKQPKHNITEEEPQFNYEKKIPAMITFFIIGLYAGFIQVGVGFLVIAALRVLTNMSLVRINSIKVFLIGIYMVASYLVFVVGGYIDWVLAITLAIGTSIGAWIGANFAVAKGDKWIKIVLSIMISIMAIKLFFNI
ncbi:MAG: sulfite exporter TauE/SafE family protein [Clostridia bacterium]|jgi:uncharacterized membrane protein YfcA|nr:sulfite exporter TauE/SafE family protein [Clostridia bacterium]